VADLRAERDLPTGHPVLLWMGRIHPEKGLPVLLEALRDRRLRHAHLLLAGEVEDAALCRELRSAAGSPELTGRVRFLDWVDEVQKSELMTLADLFVFPSRRENFGLAAAEAAASGLPVVVTEGCGVAAVVRGRAGLVCAQTPHGLAEAIDRALTEPGLLDRLRAGTAGVARQLDWPPVVAFVERLYREVLAEAGGSSNGALHLDPSPAGVRSFREGSAGAGRAAI